MSKIDTNGPIVLVILDPERNGVLLPTGTGVYKGYTELRGKEWEMERQGAVLAIQGRATGDVFEIPLAKVKSIKRGPRDPLAERPQGLTSGTEVTDGAGGPGADPAPRPRRRRTRQAPSGE